MNTYYPNTPAELAAALRAIVADLEAMPNVQMPDLAVSLNIQVHPHYGTPAERIAAVDLIASALLGVTGQTKPLVGGGWHHATPYASRRRDRIDVNTYSAVPAPVTAVAA